jgi:hypothetical protein
VAALCRAGLRVRGRGGVGMTFSIDVTSYNKTAAYPVNHGYERRTAPPTAIVVHSTEGTIGQSLNNAALYLYTTPKVSAHFLIGRGGEIIQFLDPRAFAAWHAGNARVAYDNQHSIGIECLHAKGETWPAVQQNALGWLLLWLTDMYGIAPAAIDTHGQIALPGPYKRKIDPTDWSHVAFIDWRDALVSPPPPLPVVQHYTVRGLPVYQAQSLTGPTAGYLATGDAVAVDALYADGAGHLASGLGFVDMKGLTT